MPFCFTYLYFRFIFVVTLVYFYLLFHSSYFSFCFAPLHVHLIFYIYFIIHLHSFDWPKERSKKSHAASKNLRILLLKQKIRTRHTATNKNFHGTRCAQTPGNFYCFLVNAAKFLMPRLLWHILLMYLMQIVLSLYHTLQLLIFKIYNLQYYTF